MNMTVRGRRCSRFGTGLLEVGPIQKDCITIIVAEVLLTTGIFTGWLGSRSEISKQQMIMREI